MYIFSRKSRRSKDRARTNRLRAKHKAKNRRRVNRMAGRKLGKRLT